MHKKLEKLMGRFGLVIHDNPFKVLFVLVILLAFPISHIPQIKMDTSTEGFMHDNDPVLLTYNQFREQFGRDERVIIAIENEHIFSLEFLKTLRALHQDLASEVPYLNDINSLYNVRNTRGEGDKLITDDLLEPFPTTVEEVEAIKQRALSSEFYKNLFINEKGTMTTIVLETDAYSSKGVKKVSVEDEFDDAFEEEASHTSDEPKVFLTDQENAELLKVVHEIANKYREKGLKIFVAGSPAVNNALKHQMRADMQKFMRLTFLIIFIFLFVIFRRASAVFYPLLVILLSLLATIGTMAWAGVAFKLPTQIVPSLLLAVSVGATVHILSIFFDKFNEKGDKKEALKYTLGHSGLAIAMTSVTTAIGVGSFSGSAVAPISDLGIFASLGVLISLVLTLTLLPALLSITKLKVKPKKALGTIDKLMGKLSIIPIYHTKAVLTVSLLLVSLSLGLATQIHLSHNPLKWFQPDNINRVSTEVIDKRMNGSVTIELIIDTQKKDGWIDPLKLQKLDKLTLNFEKYVDEFTHIGKVISLATIVKETNRALHENKQAFYTIPKEVNLLSQELLLFENSGSDDLEDVTNANFSKVRVSIKLPWTDSIKALDVLKYVKEESKKVFPQDKIDNTGMVPLLVNTFSNAISSSVLSYFIAGVGITLMMMFILGSARLGLVSMIPNLTPIILGLSIMYLGGMPLDMFTLLIGSIAIGLAVDDTIHFMHNFKRYYLEHGDASKAIEHTFYTTGKAMVITTIVLSLGFYAYMAANMISVQNFGILTGSVIVFALLSDLFLAPALMVVIAKRGWIK